jgi:hypothetical protein
LYPAIDLVPKIYAGIVVEIVLDGLEFWYSGHNFGAETPVAYNR